MTISPPTTPAPPPPAGEPQSPATIPFEFILDAYESAKRAHEAAVHAYSVAEARVFSGEVAKDDACCVAAEEAERRACSALSSAAYLLTLAPAGNLAEAVAKLEALIHYTGGDLGDESNAMAELRGFLPAKPDSEAWDKASAAYDAARAVAGRAEQQLSDPEIDAAVDAALDAERVLVETPAPDFSAVLVKIGINLRHVHGRLGTTDDALVALAAEGDARDRIDVLIYRDLQRLVAGDACPFDLVPVTFPLRAH